MIQRHRPPLIPGTAWKYICYASVLAFLAEICVIAVPNSISDWLIDSVGPPQAALLAFSLLLALVGISIASWRMANRRSSEQYPIVIPASTYELLEVPSNDTRFTCPECKGVGNWAKTRYEAGRWEGGTEKGQGERTVFVPDQVIATRKTICGTCSGRGYLYHMKRRFERANRSLQRLNSNLDLVNSKVEALNLVIERMNWEIVEAR